jgi:hypothetical protein
MPAENQCTDQTRFSLGLPQIHCPLQDALSLLSVIQAKLGAGQRPFTFKHHVINRAPDDPKSRQENQKHESYPPQTQQPSHPACEQ